MTSVMHRADLCGRQRGSGATIPAEQPVGGQRDLQRLERLEARALRGALAAVGAAQEVHEAGAVERVLRAHAARL
jgi:hypothetical protein